MVVVVSSSTQQAGQVSDGVHIAPQEAAPRDDHMHGLKGVQEAHT